MKQNSAYHLWNGLCPTMPPEGHQSIQGVPKTSTNSFKGLQRMSKHFLVSKDMPLNEPFGIKQWFVIILEQIFTKAITKSHLGLIEK